MLISKNKKKIKFSLIKTEINNLSCFSANKFDFRQVLKLKNSILYLRLNKLL